MVREVPRPVLPNLTVQQLDYLVAVCEWPTWTIAAAEVGVTPSALSQGLAELERRIGVPLFERAGRRRVVRADAGVVVDHAREVVTATMDLADWARRQRTGTTGAVRLGMIDLAVTHHFRDTLRRHRTRRPAVDLHLQVAPSARLLAELDAGHLDLVVGVPAADTPARPTSWLVREDELVVVAPGPVVDAPAAWGPWVSFPPDSHTRAIAGAALGRLGAPFEVVAESNQPEVLRELTDLGVGWSVLPAVQVPDVDPARVRHLTHRPLHLSVRANARLSPAAEELLDQLRADAGA